VTETKVRDELAVTLEIFPLEVVEQATAPSNHLQQALPAVMVLCVFPEVVGEVVDVLGENRHLNLRRTGVRAVRTILLDCRGLLKCHVAVFSARSARWLL
jgi:hypothetical protein